MLGLGVVGLMDFDLVAVVVSGHDGRESGLIDASGQSTEPGEQINGHQIVVCEPAPLQRRAGAPRSRSSVHHRIGGGDDRPVIVGYLGADLVARLPLLGGRVVLAESDGGVAGGGVVADVERAVQAPVDPQIEVAFVSGFVKVAVFVCGAEVDGDGNAGPGVDFDDGGRRCGCGGWMSSQCLLGRNGLSEQGFE